MTNFKTTTIIDQECYYFVYHIALQELQKNNIILNSVNSIISFTINKYANKEVVADYKNLNFLKIIDKRVENFKLFIIFQQEEIEYLKKIQKDLTLLHKDINMSIKMNQLIKSIIIDYYNNNLKKEALKK